MSAISSSSSMAACSLAEEAQEIAGQLSSLVFPKVRTYKCLGSEYLRKSHSRIIYTPFNQAAMADNLDPHWQGACNVLAWSWIHRKLQASDICQPTSYKITESHLPHPVIVGNNDTDGPDIAAIKQNFLNHGAKLSSTDQDRIENEVTDFLGAAGLVDFLWRSEIVGVHLCAAAAIRSSNLENPIDFSGHACAFVKVGDRCAWYDPNHGEVAFENFVDFALWFIEETESGALLFVVQSNVSGNKKKASTSTLYDQPKFTEEERNAVPPLSEKLVDKCRSAPDESVIMICKYTLNNVHLSRESHKAFQENSSGHWHY